MLCTASDRGLSRKGATNPEKNVVFSAIYREAERAAREGRAGPRDPSARQSDKATAGRTECLRCWTPCEVPTLPTPTKRCGWSRIGLSGKRVAGNTEFCARPRID